MSGLTTPISSGQIKSSLNHYLLVQAAGTGNLDKIIKMVDEGYDYNWKHPQAGYTSLHAAAGNGWSQVLNYLLMLPNIIYDPINATGRSPLHYAARIGHIPSINFLLDAGANPHLLDNGGETPILMAKRIGHKRAFLMLKELEEKSDSF